MEGARPRGRNGADAAHEPAAVGAWEDVRCGGGAIVGCADLRLDRMIGGCDGGETTTEREPLLAIAPGQQAVMAGMR